MPNRILKQTICTSPNLNMLSSGAETLFYRLLVLCDDYGRYYADLSILRAHCFPLRIDTTTNDMIGSWLKELVGAELVALYGAGRYLEMVNWRKHQGEPRAKSKFPEVDYLQATDSRCPQLQETVAGFSEGALPPNTNTNTNTNTTTTAETSRKESVKESDHPALEAWRNNHEGKYPTKEGKLWEVIITTVGDKPGDVKLWSDIQAAWIALSWKPTNAAGMLDYFRRREIPGANRKNGQPQPQQPKRVLRSPLAD